MFRLLRVAVFLVRGFSIVAHADPVTFSLDNVTFDSGATLTGTTVIDTATGAWISADFVYTLDSASVTFDRAYFDQISFPGGFYGFSAADVVDGPGDPNANPPTLDDFEMLAPGLSLIGYNGGPLCSDTFGCGGGINSTYFGRTNFVGIDRIATGSLVPVTSTPEPCPAILTGTGFAILGILFLSHRRSRGWAVILTR